MSSGHFQLFDDQVTPQTEARIRRLQVEYPELATFPDEDRQVSHRFDIPWVAGRNKTGTRGYISRSVGLIRDLRRPSAKVFTKVWITKYLLIHEFTEYWLMKHLGYSYEEAHHIATAAEKLAVERDHYTWASYRSELRKDIKLDSEQLPKKVPPDLDLSPYEDAGSRLLLRRIVDAQGVGTKSASQLFSKKPEEKQKSSKASAHYQYGPHGSQRCSKCNMFVPPSACTAVVGPIRPSGWCRFFEPRTKQEPSDARQDDHTDSP